MVVARFGGRRKWGDVGQRVQDVIYARWITPRDQLYSLISTVNNPTKKKKPVGSWYQEYMEDIDNKKEKETKNSSDESLSDLEDFFNSKK